MKQMAHPNKAKPVTRIYYKEDLQAGRSVDLGDAETHRLYHVLRLTPGAILTLFNGDQGEWLGEITRIDKRRTQILLHQQWRIPGPLPDVWLAFAPVKRSRIDFIAEKATELGVSRLIPVMTQFTNTQANRVPTERLQAIAREASEQCGRFAPPEVGEPVSLPALLGNWPHDRELLLAAEKGEAQSLSEIARNPTMAGKKWAVLIGPEGGFSPEEFRLFAGFPALLPINLGPRLLRADTAAIAALAFVMIHFGDWRERPEPALQGCYPVGQG